MAAAIDPTEARFPLVPTTAGHYESFFLKLCRPGERLGAWIRYTVHKRPREAPVGSLWFTLFEEAGPRASKLTLPAPAAGGGGSWVRIGEASIGDGAAVGEAEAGVAWDIRFEAGESPLFHLPRDWMYRARLPRTKLLSPAPAARFDGRLSVDGREIAVEGWRGMVGHNWGRAARGALDLAPRADAGRLVARRGDREGEGRSAGHAVGGERSDRHRRPPPRPRRAAR